MAKKMIRVENDTIYFTENEGEGYQMRFVPEFSTVSPWVQRFMLHAVKQKLSDACAGKGAKAGYSPVERKEIRDRVFTAFTKKQWNVKRERVTTKEAVIRKAVANGLSREDAEKLVTQLGL